MVSDLVSGVDETGRVVYRLTYECWCGAPGIKTIPGPRPREAV
jgi:hypothetical protein